MWRKGMQWLSAACLLAAVAARPAAAQGFGAVGDTFVSSANAAMNFGAFTYAEVGLHGLPKNDVDRALLRFDLSTLPADASIERAVLRLFINLTSSDPLGLSTTVFSLATGFDENTVTWNTQPAVAPGPTATAVMNTMAGDVFEIDITALVLAQRQANPGGEIVLRIAATDESIGPGVIFFDFRTKEFEAGDQRAQLVITRASPAPLLSGWSLLAGLAAIAAIGSIALRRVAALR